MPKRTTIKDIARLADTSVSTVSRALQDSPLISDAKKQQIKEVAEKHNFRINTRARNFRTQKSHTIGVIMNVSDIAQQEISDPFLFNLVAHIAQQLSSYRYDLLLSTTTAFSCDLAMSYVEEQKVDGLIILGQGDKHEEIEKLAKTDAPFILWGANNTDGGYITVGSDNVTASFNATQHLIENCNCEQIAFIGDTTFLEIEHRYLGFKKAMKLHSKENSQLERTHVQAAFCENSGYNAMRQLIKDIPSIDGAICASDAIALGALNYLKETGVRVPQDFSLIGFDDIHSSKYCSPTLSTVHQKVRQGASLLVEKILQLIEGKQVSSSQMEAELIVRESTR